MVMLLSRSVKDVGWCESMRTICDGCGRHGREVGQLRKVSLGFRVTVYYCRFCKNQTWGGILSKRTL
jgi:hypothetical protein